MVVTGDDLGPALRRILDREGGPELFELLAGKLSGADLTSLLLEVFRRRALRRTPAEVVRRYREDRFVLPAATDVAALRRAEDALFAALPEGFEALALAPVVPLATHTAVATVDPRKVIATVRATEVAADPTNALALEAAVRRSRGDARVRLAASQRVIRAQRFDAPGALAHFQLFGLVTADRDTGNRAFERRELAEHLRFAVRALTAAGARRPRLRLTALDEEYAPLVEEMRASVDAEVLADPGRTSGRGYYTGLCFKAHAEVGGEELEIGDGGFVDWTRKLTGNRKERLLISGFGVDRLTGPVPSS